MTFSHSEDQVDLSKTMMPYVIRNGTPAYNDPVSTLVMDSKGLFGALDNDLPQDDRKSAVEVPSIEEFMRRAMCRPRWCPHNRNAADAMTKFKGAHSEPLFTLPRTGMFICHRIEGISFRST